MNKDTLLLMQEVYTGGKVKRRFNTMEYRLDRYVLTITKVKRVLHTTITKVNRDSGVTYFFADMEDFRDSIKQ